MQRRQSKIGMVDGRSVSPAQRREAWDNTGTFGSFRRPPVVGVSDTVAYSNRMSAKAARRAERAWLKSLPKGVTV